ncbi:MAG: ribonuclease III [bacterium]
MTSEPTLRGDFAELEERLNYRFTSPSILLDALTHPSYVNEHPDVSTNNQRMEFLGDSVLGLVMATQLFASFPESAEGALSSGLAQLVCESALADVARSIELGAYLRMGRGEELSGGRSRSSVLADAYEALLAAIYLDGGLEPVEKIVATLHADAIQACQLTRSSQDFKSRLQKLVQGAKSAPPAYRIVHEDGPPHERRFVAEVVIEGEGVAQGQGRTKKEAEQAAASVALESLLESMD